MQNVPDTLLQFAKRRVAPQFDGARPGQNSMRNSSGCALGRDDSTSTRFTEKYGFFQAVGNKDHRSAVRLPQLQKAPLRIVRS